MAVQALKQRIFFFLSLEPILKQRIELNVTPAPPPTPMAAALPQSHLRLPLRHTPTPSAPRCRRRPGLVAFARLQNPTTGTHPVLPPPAPPPSAALLAAEGSALAPRREYRFPGSVASPPSLSGLAADAADDDDAVLRRALEVRRAVAKETLVAVLHGGKVGGMTYIKNLTARMGRFVDRIVVEAAAMRRDRPEHAHQSFNARARTYIQESGLVELIK